MSQEPALLKLSERSRWGPASQLNKAELLYALQCGQKRQQARVLPTLWVLVHRQQTSWLQLRVCKREILKLQQQHFTRCCAD